MESTSTITIGALSNLTGVPVRTIRFYCDEGLLDTVRSAGGHRRFDPSAVDRLRLVRRLRVLGLGLSAITAVLTGERSLGEAVAAERAALDVELDALAWRHATLRAVESAEPHDRAARLELLAALDGGTAASALHAFWDRVVAPDLTGEAREVFVSSAVPPRPARPAPEQVVAYTGMVAAVNDADLVHRMRTSARAKAQRIEDEEALLLAMEAAITAAAPAVHAGLPPSPGPEADALAAAHAKARGTSDGPEFRRALLDELRVDRDPRLRRYWALHGDLTGAVASPGTVHLWLLDSLARS